ncbi:uncharacterized protein MONOS_5622 [Monocercomonoides exilis]|uniref:uncharacterized protein n=1 Tax=Monocercomonoides exilis TaxID=2049356 RepID=UPI003559E15C|nr:hypothetical protein MONOS_5622 [Monocercomonoides exilis]|eukprot:MONOS_5622.1-p1 / transcript=MONOS_5622.1 / gene=MONOS_5622 / organism=Monocercomonoides_exilis_PA203 / gene_product=unspecified product / transcript_product=unspecified product / location=Mono_scaffold00166:16935-17591(+) / protein_length=142 / sequence_SO=supercontig / SO=protein_coding / is_pseudo=false
MSEEKSRDRIIIGAGFIGFGVFFFILGILTLFDSGFIAIGDIMFLIGLIVYQGPKDAIQLFIGKSENKIVGTISFVIGLILVFLRYPFLGVIFQSGGAFPLFKNYLPKVVSFLTGVLPGGRMLLSIPWIARLAESGREGPIL